jgi:hypothetical protein
MPSSTQVHSLRGSVERRAPLVPQQFRMAASRIVRAKADFRHRGAVVAAAGARRNAPVGTQRKTAVSASGQSAAESPARMRQARLARQARRPGPSLPRKDLRNAETPARIRRGFSMNWGGDLLSHPVSRAVPSALEGLTSLFGMGRGVAPPPLPPQTNDNRNTRRGLAQSALVKKTGQASRLISTGRLKPSQALHLPPIDVVIFDEPSGG